MKNNYLPLKKGKAESESSFWINIAALVFAIAVMMGCRYAGFTDLMGLFFVMVVVTTLSVECLEYFCYPQTCALRQWKILRKVNRKRVFYKEVALVVTLGIIGFIYWLFPFWGAAYYNPYFSFLHYLIGVLLVLSLPYFALMDKIDKNPDDEYYKIGYAIIHLKKTMTRFELGNYIRSWLVKAFWLSLMQPEMLLKINGTVNIFWNEMQVNPVILFWNVNLFCYFIDLVYGSIGYIINFKIFNTQTRTAEPTLFGWLATICCYGVFWNLLLLMGADIVSKNSWIDCINTESLLWKVWFVIIISLEMVQAMSTIAFGLKFSNLTYRGLINTGPYKYTKHPGYVAKSLSWWFIYVPFLGSNYEDILRSCLMLFAVNIIYYLRARTEERHLSHYPEYEAYALAMNEKSIFRWTARILPFLKYKPLPKDKRLF